MQIEFVLGEKADVSELENLYNDLNDFLESSINYPGWKKGVYPTREHAENDIAEQTLYVAKHNGKIVGSIVLNHEPEADPVKGKWMVEASADEYLAVHRLVVHPGYLRCGIGVELLNYADRLAKAKNMKAIRLDVYEGNAAAIKTYEKCGYTYIDTVDIGLGQYGLDWFRLYEKLVQSYSQRT